MISDNTYKLLALLIQSIGVLALIFYLGKYVGESSSMFKTLFQAIKDLKTTYEAHVVEDENRHTILTKEIADVRVSVAANAVIKR